ncbi:DUF6434 domain-containing protein [Sporosarcina sp.]|uniref:DUF6434 domain-containing protein n=1 Tax=Sporosarcina sp. TaxID=49982 RepID=UPI00260D6FC1|nr:DUF6434 domain-containing protein [Sporosarcina sp.]
MRPELDKELKANEFRDFYWLKEELQIFCREHGMSASGSKSEITERIAIFLETGKTQKPMRKRSPSSQEMKLEELRLDTVITEYHRCSQVVRVFFQSVIPKFHFSTYIQDYFKGNVGKTYRDVVDAWYEEEERKKDPSYKTQIGSQFEYNQFTRDYFADPKNMNKNREDLIEAWNIVKSLPGSNKYNG